MTSRIVDPETLADGSLAVIFFCKAFRAASLEPDGRVLAHMQRLIDQQDDWIPVSNAPAPVQGIARELLGLASQVAKADAAQEKAES